MKNKEMKVELNTDKYEDERDKEKQGKTWKRKQIHSGSRNTIHFQTAYIVTFISHQDSYLQYMEKAYLVSSVPKEQIVREGKVQ